MSDTLYMISPFDVPLLQLIGKDSLANPCTAVKHEWLEDELRGLDSTIVTLGDLNNATAAVANATCTAGHGLKFRINDIVEITSAVGVELVRLTSAMSTDTFTIAATTGRGYGNAGTGIAHSGLPTLRIIGNVNLQDAAVGGARTTTKSTRVNYTQIFESAVVVTSTLQAIKKYVEQDEMAAQMERELRLMWIQMERALISGKYVAPTASVPGALAGIIPTTTTNAYAKAGAYLTEEFILQALNDIWAAGATPTTIVSGAFQRRQMNKFLDSMRLTTRTDRVAGSVVDTYTSTFGTVDLLLDRNMPTDTVLVIDKARIGFGPLRDHALKVVEIPQTTGLKNTKQLYGQYTAELRNQGAHAKITGLATA
ncbi:MAG: DUF5309 domain-containing protein [Anaerolineales bacterium]|nr:DUF5309 domain-containing protein [Anaerolineales bacterium]